MLRIFKNFLAFLMGSVVAAFLFVSADFLWAYIHIQPWETTRREPHFPPPESYARNPDPNVPPEFMIPYPGMAQHYFAPDVEERIDYELWNEYVDDLGAVPRANASVRHQLRKGKKFIHNVTYKTDEFGRRITPVKNREKRDKFIAFFGCSFVWGSCLQENETIPAYVAKLAPRYMPYNYGRGASGTNYLLALLENRKINKQINEKEGLGLYVFINDHIDRSVPNIFYAASMFFMPYYEYQDGRLKRNGSFITGKPIETNIYRAADRMQLYQHFPFPSQKYNEYHYNYICDMIQLAQEKFMEQFPKAEFYVLFHPQHSSYAEGLAPCLDHRQIKYLIFNNLFSPGEERLYTVPYDGHPNATANYKIAEAIVKRLKLDQ